MSALAAAIDALATFRLTRLVVEDQLTVEWRDALISAAYATEGREATMVRALEEMGLDMRPGVWADQVVPNDPDPPKLAYLITCPWCAGMYVAAGVAIARRLAPRPWQALAKVLALSAAAGIIASATE